MKTKIALVLLVVGVGMLVNIGRSSAAIIMISNGSCGTANGSNFSSIPDVQCINPRVTGLINVVYETCQPFCSSRRGASKATVSGSTISWTCYGGGGGSSASCSAKLSTNGTCGSSNGLTLLSVPTTGLCSSGTQSAVSGTGPWTWTCNGINGGTTSSCRANKIPSVNGDCGLSDGQTLAAAPTANFCDQGVFSGLSGSGPWNWSCIGSNGGTTASCQALKLSPPPTYTCSARICSPIYKYARENTFTSSTSDCRNPIGAKTYTNDCSCTVGIFNYSNFTNVCNPPINATCGSANAVSSLTQPTTNLCGDGSVPGVTKNATTWDWTCLGKNGGVNATCSAPIMTNGTCGSANNQTFTTAPTTNLCADGSTPGVTGVGSALNPWSWTCSGSNGGASKNCAATMTMPTLNFSVTSPIQKGGTATIAWNTTNTASCWASGGWTGWKPNISNSENITPITESPYPKSITYNMECWNAAGNSTGMKTATLEIQCTSNYTDYRCEKTAPATCSPETCDQTQTGQAFCFQKDENSCNGAEVPRPLSECTANGVTCVADSLVCPQCVKTGNWREVGL